MKPIRIKKENIRKLRIKLVLSEIVFLLLIVGGMVTFYSLFAKDYYIARKEQVILNAYSALTLSGLDSITDGTAELDRYETESINFIVTDEEFTPLYSTESHDVMNKVSARIINYKEQFAEDAQCVVQRNEHGDYLRIALRGLLYQGDRTFYLLIYEDILGMENAIGYYNVFMLYLLLFTLLAGIIYAWLISRWISIPIEQIDKITRRITEKDFTARYTGRHTEDELGRLSRNINRMADTIQQDRNQLENYNAALIKQNQTMEGFERLQKQFVSNVTHELKTPLAIILNQAEMAQFDTNEEKRQYYLESIEEEVQKMSRMISQVLSLSLNEQKLQNIVVERVNVSEICTAQVKKYQAWLAQRELRCETEIEANCVALFSRAHLEQILNNFVTNAYKNAPKGAVIRISLRKMGNQFRLSVYNDGEPIPEKAKEKIWTGYFQLKAINSGVEAESGVGLGLFIVKDIVKTYCGHCDFTNCPAGVEFWAMLPTDFSNATGDTERQKPAEPSKP